MASSKLTQKDEQFIQDLMEDKGSFFFKEGSRGKKVFRRRRGGFGFGFRCSRSFIGVYISIGRTRHGIGYSRAE